ncbi:hypothetical protein [Glycomyces sp. NPDC048151]|uniref:hypothetical protein n=1 Tax=Glycomyces sp. NPDC048151 TaxID=3364002 RepID=UPI0037147067
MGDGGDGGGLGGEAIDYSAAELPVEIAAQTTVVSTDGGGDDYEDLGFVGIGGGAAAGPSAHERRPDDEVIELIWRNAPYSE